MHKSNKLAHANLIQLGLDIIFLAMSFLLAYLFADKMSGMNNIKDYCWILILFIPFWISIMAQNGMYDQTTFYYLDRVLRNVVLASTLSGLGLATMFFFIKENGTSRLFIGMFFVLCIIIMFTQRILFGKILRRNIARNNAPQVIVVCSRETFMPFIKFLGKTQIRYNIVGIVQVGDGAAITDVLRLGRLENLGQILKTRVVDEVIFTIPASFTGDWYKYVRICEQMGITTQVILNMKDLQHYRIHVSMLGTLPVLTFHTVTLNPVQKTVKRLVDICGALVGIIITLLLSIFIVPAIKLDSPGPVLFVQKRVGRNGRFFNIYKFRTMQVDAEAKKHQYESLNEHKNSFMFKITDDPRVTKIGAILRKTSLDELPQFFNVLEGEMSLVGTRPPTLEEYKQYDYEHMRRLSIKPGITGMWQVNGRSSINDFDMVVAMDTQYIDNWSFWVDIDILLKTVVKVVRMTSAY
jgi:exopolysaccharide biosynthesis polyprenyl glycosylphosphotransferase